MRRTNINSKTDELPTVLSDIRVHLAALARSEPLSADGAGLIMMVGRLLTMIEADRQAGQGAGDAEAAAAVVAQITDRGFKPEDRRSLFRTAIDRYVTVTEAMQEQRMQVAASDARPQTEAVTDPQQRFTQFLSRKAGRAIGPLKRFHRITGGYSKTSIAVQLAPEDEFGWGTSLIVRMDVKDGPTSFTVADEFPLLKRLHGSAVPVAQPFHCETDASVLGQPFLVSALMPGISAASGDPTVAAWGGDAKKRQAVGVQIARALGALHSVAPTEAATLSATEQVRAYLREWRERWQGLGAPPEPGLALAFEWLDENAPKAIERLAYVHGDFAPYNALQDDGRLTAVIDWEFVHLGDPAEDVGYCRKYMESLLPWEEFLRHYYASGGPEYRSDSAAFYEVWCNVRNAVVLLQGRQAYVSGRNRDLKVLYAPAEFYHYFLLQALKAIQAQI